VKIIETYKWDKETNRSVLIEETVLKPLEDKVSPESGTMYKFNMNKKIRRDIDILLQGVADDE